MRRLARYSFFYRLRGKLGLFRIRLLAICCHHLKIPTLKETPKIKPIKSTKKTSKFIYIHNPTTASIKSPKEYKNTSNKKRKKLLIISPLTLTKNKEYIPWA